MFNTFRVKQTLEWANRKGNGKGNRGNPMPADRKGTVIGISRFSNCARVIWDGTKTAQSIHLDFLQRIDDSWPSMTGLVYPNRSTLLYLDYLYSNYKRKAANFQLR